MKAHQLVGLCKMLCQASQCKSHNGNRPSNGAPSSPPLFTITQTTDFHYLENYNVSKRELLHNVAKSRHDCQNYFTVQFRICFHTNPLLDETKEVTLWTKRDCVSHYWNRLVFVRSTRNQLLEYLVNGLI